MPLQADEKAVFIPQWMFTQETQLEGKKAFWEGGGTCVNLFCWRTAVLPMSNSGLFLINYHV